VFACDGIPQRRANFPKTHKWVIRRRSGENLSSTFATVFEPFNESAPYIQQVEAVAVSPSDGSAAVSVTHAAGTDIIFWTAHPETEHSFGGYTVTGRAACIRLDAQGTPTVMRLFDGTQLKGAGQEVTSDGVARATIASVGYENSTVTLDEPVLRDTHVGLWVMVDTGQHADAVRIDEIIDEKTFSLGKQDLRCGIGNVLGITDGNLIQGDRLIYFAHPGMTVVNEGHETVGHFASRERNDMRMAEKTVPEEAFNDLDGDGRRRFIIMAIGPGDTIGIPARADFSAN